MRCPYCFSKYTFVIDTRWIKTKVVTRRRYGCRNCERRFTSYEQYDGKTLRFALQEDKEL